MFSEVLTPLLLAAIGLGCYVLLIRLSAWYARVTEWQPPAGNQANNWLLRRNIGLTLGGLAVVACAVGATVWQLSWQMRLLTMIQAALLAAAGASDLQRFQLPLPLTLLGTSVAICTLLLARVPILYLFFGLIWVLVVITLHALFTKGSMQLGDHIATVWIAVVSPANGLLAITLGDVANVIFARVKGLQGKKVAAAGTWLIFATSLAAMPPYFLWFSGQVQAYVDGQLPSRIPLQEPTPRPFPYIAPPKSVEQVTPEEVTTAASLLNLADWAGQRTASVAMAENHAGRVAIAEQQATYVRQYAEFAQQVAPNSEEKVTLVELAGALSSFDLEGIRNASQKLAQERERLANITVGVVTTYTEQVSNSLSLSHEAFTARVIEEKR